MPLLIWPSSSSMRKGGNCDRSNCERGDYFLTNGIPLVLVSGGGMISRLRSFGAESNLARSCQCRS